MKINNEYEIGQTAYLKTDKEQLPRVITGILIRPGALIYYVTSIGTETGNYDFELSATPDVMLSSTN